MSSLKNKITKFIPTSYFENKIQKSEESRFSAEAKKIIAEMNISEKEKDELYKNWYNDYKIYFVTFDEYFNQYNFPALTKEQKDEYISVSSMQKIYRLCGDENVRAVFRDKPTFLKKFKEFIHRDWMMIDDNTDRKALDTFFAKYDVIVKPINGTRGDGVAKIEKGTMTAEQFVGTHKGEWLAEECIVSEKTLSDFHSNSLNTIRFVTFSNNGVCKPVISFFRSGSGGGVIDNYHGGGLSAAIDIETGVIVSDGKGESGIPYECHPDSGIRFKGTQIPKWDEITEVCVRAASTVPGIKFAGWDVIINSKGEIEFIEGNHAPDMDIPQSIMNCGYKKYFLSVMEELGIRAQKSVK